MDIPVTPEPMAIGFFIVIIPILCLLVLVFVATILGVCAFFTTGGFKKTNADQQRQIDELKRELEILKGK
jgi:uncharacterized membrane protein